MSEKQTIKALPAHNPTQVKKLGPVSGFLSGGLAACGAVTLTNPFEVIKTRFQLQGQLTKLDPSKRIYKSVGQAFSLIARHEGIRGLQRGLGTAYVYQICLNGCRLGFYEPIRRTLNTWFLDDPKGNKLAINVASGAGSGLCGALFGSPFFLVKTRMQSYSPKFPVGQQYGYKHIFNAFSRIIKENGVKGLFVGADAAILRTVSGSSVQLPIYNWAKRMIEHYNLLEEGMIKHLTASAVSGFGVCCTMQIFDTVMTRMYNQKNKELYKNPIDCILKTIRSEGFFALYKGFGAHLARIAPHTIFCLTFVEQTNKLFLKFQKD
ncbi:mitochondrial carrier, ocaloacetate family anion [Schizosaccharomyces pombe]|uniref:Mitochondrial oxaloacetate transport protein n=1 Tax=Schizosaccharomyces pombe (strain 972 / ATCC 24843) TaxID=284812 RepID=OAC1_SCHPO|nr:putative anion transporter [Schizosaccharomyces pombe]Q9UTN1.1 RecName: Full=Mitochondrial oxaloacetate transport protein [Schizosaccharomyces pombe 972h-]CAB59616.1 mitochondrial anion transporter (predicted) [Schizosaccharomyces pombe]|eukprot:NP_593169.1 putative anion transporter [Schizosaccharomyces pombe]